MRKDLFQWGAVARRLGDLIELPPEPSANENVRNKEKRISIVLLLQNNPGWLAYLEKKLTLMAQKHNYVFDVYAYENNSAPEFKAQLRGFVDRIGGSILSENNKSEKFASIISSERALAMAKLRNKAKNMHGHLRSEYTWLVDSDVFFYDDILERYTARLEEAIDVVAVSSRCIGRSESDAINGVYSEHYFDCLPFRYGKYNYTNTCNTCLMQDCDRCKNHRRHYNIHIPDEDLIRPGSVVYPESAFGSNTLLRTDVYNQLGWPETGNFECEWLPFFEDVGRHGKVAVDTSIISYKSKDKLMDI
tara:strand:- start:285 stop:1196 length:912 start_codon:yes stop_codon:yes gene_type:complete